MTREVRQQLLAQLDDELAHLKPQQVGHVRLEDTARLRPRLRPARGRGAGRPRARSRRARARAGPSDDSGDPEPGEHAGRSEHVAASRSEIEL
jgi:hypothetical protein